LPLSSTHSSKVMSYSVSVSGLALLLLCCLSYAQAATSLNALPSASSDSGRTVATKTPAATLYLKVRLDPGVKASALKPGEVITGRLSQGVYFRERELFPSGSQVRLTVDKLRRRRKAPSSRWPWVVSFVTPRHENYPSFQSASIVLPDGSETPLRVSLISISNEVDVHAKPKKSAKSTHTTETSKAPASESSELTAEKRAKGKAATVATLEAEMLTPQEAPSTSVMREPVTLAAGTEAKIILLGDVSASKSHAGDSIQARIVEPVRLGSEVVLPEGTLLDGTIVKTRPPRMLSRAGSLLLTFTGLTLPGGNPNQVVASLTAAELNPASHTIIDTEGTLHGDKPGLAWMLLNTGVTAGLSKVADDSTQVLVEAIVSTATNASTAGTARIVAACVSGVFMLTRHGRDVVLPKFTQVEITFDRPVSLAGGGASAGVQ
jgi:hypothetical protein